jgi:hypothetical protein
VIGMDFITASLAIMILKPMRQKFLAKTKNEMVASGDIAPAF